MAKSTPLAHSLFAIPTNWLIADLLPQAELVLLDGAPGVGKSILLAHFAAAISRFKDVTDHLPALYLSSLVQQFLRVMYLRNHRADLQKVHEVSFSAQAFCQQSKSDNAKPLYRHFLEFVERSLQENHPRMLIIDDLEDLLRLSPPQAEYECDAFWNKLKLLAWSHNCTLIVPRVNGLNECRQYGPMARWASRHASFILTMHYHPFHADRRVVTVAKNQKGAMGMQWHVQFTPKGMIVLQKMESHQHVRPAKSPQTWQRDEAICQQEEEIIAAVHAHMNGQAVKKVEMEQHITQQLQFPQRAYVRAMKKLKLTTGRDGVDWLWLPTALVSEALQLTAEEAIIPPRARGAGDGAVAELKKAG